MISNRLRIIGLVLGALLVAGSGVYVASNARLRQSYTVPVASLAIPTDEATIERGQHLAVAVTHCTGCHGPSLAGQIMIDAPPFQIVASNLTRGQGGVGSSFGDDDWVRAIRHGVRPDGSPLMIMPSDDYHQLSEADLAAIIAYVKSVPPVDNMLPATTLRPLGRVLLLAGQLNVLSAAKIDHAAALPAPVAVGATAAYGGYLAAAGGCQACHGGNLAGGVVPDGSNIHAPAITAAGLSNWSEADFVRAMREGVTPDGRRLAAIMPWRAVGQLSDDELRALWRYLQSLPPS